MEVEKKIIDRVEMGAKANNHIVVTMEALPQNEKLARNIVASFLLELNPTIEELSDIKTCISEAVTNCIVHGYNGQGGIIVIDASLFGNTVLLKISDHGVGIDDIKKAMQPFFTSRPEEERSGMGFTVMETFMDDISVEHNFPCGVTVKLAKVIKQAETDGV